MEAYLEALDKLLKGDSVVTKQGMFKYLSKLNLRERDKVKGFIGEPSHKDPVQVMGYLVDYEQTQKKSSKAEMLEKAGILKIDSYQQNIENFHKTYPFFYDKSKIFWFWNDMEFKYEIVDEVDIMSTLDSELNFCGQTVTSNIKSNYIEALKRVGRMNIPKDAPVKWVQFKDKGFSITSYEIHDITPEYFFTNPIGWEIGETEETPIMDKLFKEWVGEKYVETLYELIAYCCYRAYPIQILFCLWGSGRNGKSQFLKILDKFIGTDNTTTSELDMIMENRFETFKMYKKLLCLIGETNFGVVSKTGVMKKLTGGDKIRYEMKNKSPFDDYSYTKMIIASNSLPSTTDTSDGFFRRWLIIDFPNEFEEIGKEVWEDVPDIEYKNLAKKVTRVLPLLLGTGVFTNQGTIPDRRKKYISVSNPLSLFIKESCVLGESEFVLMNRLYTEYVKYLAKNKRRRVKLGEFKTALEDEGVYVERTSKRVGEEWTSGRWAVGINFNADYDTYDTNPIQPPSHGDLSEIVCKTDIKDIEDIMNTIIRYINIHREHNLDSAELMFGKDKIEALKTKGVLFLSGNDTLKVLD